MNHRLSSGVLHFHFVSISTKLTVAVAWLFLQVFIQNLVCDITAVYPLVPGLKVRVFTSLSVSIRTLLVQFEKIHKTG